jgi:hypothetical protein
MGCVLAFASPAVLEKSSRMGHSTEIIQNFQLMARALGKVFFAAYRFELLGGRAGG